ncbi:hypothetical protein FF38_12666 [Lucilia cuprina]|uniref:Uncharacterized protein n=1 Tax=Lucilia cuprina TaxID=7375 RepID=A0A0L0C4I5_LUCCU|nr:hypothetical protein FF38_12666 [Lucilia cuprina]
MFCKLSNIGLEYIQFVYIKKKSTQSGKKYICFKRKTSLVFRGHRLNSFSETAKTTQTVIIIALVVGRDCAANSLPVNITNKTQGTGKKSKNFIEFWKKNQNNNYTPALSTISCSISQ